MGDRKLRINLGRSTSKTIPYISRCPVNQPGAVSVNTWDNHSSPLLSPPPGYHFVLSYWFFPLTGWHQSFDSGYPSFLKLLQAKKYTSKSGKNFLVRKNSLNVVRKLVHLSQYIVKAHYTEFFSILFSYVQVIVIQLKEDQNLEVSTHEKYSEANIYRDYKVQVEGEPYITAEFNYGTIKFRIGDGKYYSRSVQRQRQAIGETYLLLTTRLQKPKANMGFATLEG